MRARARSVRRRRGAWPALLLVAAACGSGGESPVRLAAAASLSGILPGVLAAQAIADVSQVDVVYGGSGELAAQLRRGAAFDAVLLASDAAMGALGAEGLIAPASRRRPFANRVQLVALRDAGTAGELDAVWPGLVGRRVAVGAEGVPVGDAASLWLTRAGLDSGEVDLVLLPHVRAVVAAVESGACDAGFVYATDVMAHPRLEVLASDPRPVTYGAGVTAHARRPLAAEAVLAALESAGATWRDAGFLDVEDAAAGEAPPASAPLETDLLGILWRTLWIGLLAVLVELPFALALGRLLARREFAGKTLLRALLTLPMFLPPVAVGLLLLLLIAPQGPLGAMGEAWLYAPQAAVLAAAVVSFPLLLRHAEEALAAVPVRLVQVSRTLGASRWRTFVRIELPMARRGLAAGLLLAFARGIAEFGATAVVAGTVPGSTETLSTGLHRRLLAGDDRGALTLAGLSIALGLAAVVASELLHRKRRRKP